jgi:ketosteroid isomerase-like protein
VIVRLPALLLIFFAAAGCPKAPTIKKNVAPEDLVGPESTPDEATLRADLEMTIREAHRALSGGYDEAYLDGLSRDERLVMFVLGPEALVGHKPVICKLRRQFYEDVEFVSKRLEVHISADGTTGWSNDELSYRVWHDERRVLIPVRATGVYERRAGKWLLVQEHMSYGIADDELEAMSVAGTAAAPQPIKNFVAPGDDAATVHDLVTRLVADADDARDKHVSVAARALFVGSDPTRVYRGKQMTSPDAALTVRGLFGYDSSAQASELRVKLSTTGTVAWAAANVVVEKQREGGEPVELRLRATWVLEKQNDGVWRAVQTHVSVPICPRELRIRAFGEPDPPDDSNTPGCGQPAVAHHTSK